MCGFAGLVSPSSTDLDRVVQRMLEPIRMRGPDDSGIWIDSDNGVALGHRRLSIVDLSPTGHQPMHSHTGRFVIDFNGEIYNFRTLRRDLEKLGAQFKGTSDTEVMLSAFEHYGVSSALSRITGMFAFAVYDRDERTLHLARDRMGEKPLYFGWAPSGHGLYFGSDLRALTEGLSATERRSFPVSNVGATLLLKYGYIPAPHTIFEGVYKLLPATSLSFSLTDCATKPATFSPYRGETGVIAPKSYWDLARVVGRGESPALQQLSLSEASVELEQRLSAIVADQMVADVPVGAFLSGGIDSSTVVALMQSVSPRPIETFSIGFTDPAYDEAPYARAIARHLRTTHHELYVSPEDLLRVVPTIAGTFSEPFADSSQIPTYLVSQLARTKVTVSLSGDGGDELFAGYPRLLWARRLAQIRRVAPHAARNAFAAVATALPVTMLNAALRAADPLLPRSLAFRELGAKLHKVAEALRARCDEEMYDILLTVVGNELLNQLGQDLLLPPVAMTDPRAWPVPDTHISNSANIGDWLTWADTAQYLPDDILVKVDRCAMAHSLETRVPFLDHSLIEYVYSLPHRLRNAQSPGKPLLKSVLARHVPTALIDRPKMGFSVPIERWLRGELRDWAQALLTRDRIEATGVLSNAAVQALWNEHQSGRSNHHTQLWHILMLCDWQRAYVEMLPGQVRP